MSKLDINKELGELITRFKLLKKAIDEENTLSPAQRAAAAVAEELTKARKPAPNEEQQKAQNLARLMKSRGILGTKPPPRQPTDEEMFGHLVPTEEAINKAEQQWSNGLNNWMLEATRPLNARFKTPEEEQKYWDSIKVQDDGKY